MPSCFPQMNRIKIIDRLEELIKIFQEEEDDLKDFRKYIEQSSNEIAILNKELKLLGDNEIERREELMKLRMDHENTIRKNEKLIEDIENDRSVRNTSGNEKREEVIEKLKYLPGDVIIFIWNLIAYLEDWQMAKTSKLTAPRNPPQNLSIGWKNNNNGKPSLIPQNSCPLTLRTLISPPVRRHSSPDRGSSRYSNPRDGTQSMVPYAATLNSTTGDKSGAPCDVQAMSLNPDFFHRSSSLSNSLPRLTRLARKPERKLTSDNFSKFTDSVLDSLAAEPKALTLNRNENPTFQSQMTQFGQKMIEEANHEKQQNEQRAALQLQAQEQVKNEKNELERRRRENEALEEQKNAENDRKRSLELQRRLEEKEKENEQNVRRAKEKRERYEQETKRLIEENLNRFNETTKALLYCLQMKYKFDQKEKEWADCLQTLRDAIANAKKQFSNFSILMGREQMYRKNDSIMKSGIKRLHHSTLMAYNLICNVWYKMEGPSRTEYSDRIFLRILLKNFTEICDKLYMVLRAIDDFESQKGSLTTISDAFSKINAFDVYDTRQLRELSSKAHPADYEHVLRPIQYIKPTYP